MPWRPLKAALAINSHYSYMFGRGINLTSDFIFFRKGDSLVRELNSFPKSHFPVLPISRYGSSGLADRRDTWHRHLPGQAPD